MADYISIIISVCVNYTGCDYWTTSANISLTSERRVSRCASEYY